MRRLIATIGLGYFLLASLATAETNDTPRFDYYRWTGSVTGGRALVQVQYQVTIPSAAGNDFASILVSESEYSKVKNVDLRLMGPKGKPIQRLKKDELTKACGFGAGFELYTDICHYYGSVACPSYPAVIEGEYTIEYDNLFFLTAPEIQQVDASVTLAEISMTYPSDFPVAWKAYGLTEAPVVTSAGKLTTVSWRLENIPPDPETRRLPLEEIGLPKISFAPESFELEGYKVEGRTWKNLGLWYNQLAANQYLPDGTTVAAAHSTREDAGRIFLDLTRATRYVAVEVGISGWQPHAATLVQSRGYGDCKDLSTLLISRLRAAGVVAWPVLVRTRELGLLDTSFVENYFNHVITCAVFGADTLWLDPTCTECLPGDLPAMDENTLALLMDSLGGTIVRLPESRAEENKIARVADVSIDDSAFTQIQVAASISGNFSHSVRGFLKHAEADQLADYTHDFLVAGDRRYTMVATSQSGVDSLELPVKMFGQMKGTRTLDRVKQTAYVNPFVLVGRDKVGDLRLAGRTSAVEFGYPWMVYDSVSVGGPYLAKCDSITLPADDSCSFPGGKLVLTYRKTSAGAYAVARQEYHQTTVFPDRFGELQAFLTSLRKLLDRPIKLHLRSVLDN